MLEITETFLVHDIAAGLASLEALKALGVRLVVDDFGTRYSSLSYPAPHAARRAEDRPGPRPLHRLDIELPNRAIVAAILAMPSTLGLVAVTEGVKTAAQAAALRQLGCQFAQGFHYAPPMASHELTRHLPPSR